MIDKQASSTSPKAQNIANEVRRRIVEREWRQGDRIPDEADLAIEFDVARATVNKALQLLAAEGLLDRRRRAGTRVAVDPVRKATFTISIVREQVEQAGMTYSHRVVAQRRSPVPADIAARFGLPEGEVLVHMRALHYGDGQPFQLEDRWINPRAAPGLESADFRQLNANEWLVRNAPYLRAELAFSAENADRRDARLLQTQPGQALLIMHRTTWNDLGPITTVRVAYQPGHLVGTENNQNHGYWPVRRNDGA
ncbi:MULTISPECIES: GntR family transcriptional regulator [Brucella]|uniref:GntR family transcriptional regulator n=1 Tax=Brucella inopinata TaxID=1218315 RepID=A0AAW7BA96_9HYPH|nr:MULTISPECIES: GntR family transcriptional regulator [Brucella]EFM56062.1 Histidine utilization repressor [Brucella inopinata BO1]KEY04980.1 GntR family transcriptional regulator [Brucella suis bv. 4 str. 40]MDL2333441.1 GntR family transcriptional regulator [Brucella inopinata]QGA58791.1 UTRA domain-containing protein [Brucella sp. 2280]